MLFPIIRIRDKGETIDGRIVGTNSHDVLELAEDGNYRWQCRFSGAVNA